MLRPLIQFAVVVSVAVLLSDNVTQAGQLTVQLKNVDQVTFVGAVDRWDIDGNPRQPVDPKGRIEKPAVTATATRDGEGNWVFANLPAGRYDLVILTGSRTRIEGFTYPPVLEFDPLVLHSPGSPPPDSAIQWITEHIAAMRLHENKVAPLYFAGNDKQIRVLVQLLRDEPTSYDGMFGEQVATLRHEVWQYTNRYGGWEKEKRSRVFDRTLMAKRELRTWTWVWTPELGGIQVAAEPVTVTYAIPAKMNDKATKGLLPY